jgi:hypothetical protein
MSSENIDQSNQSKTLSKNKKAAKMKRFAQTLGQENNLQYNKFKPKDRLVANLSNTKYFIVKFVLKSLFNFKISHKPQDLDKMDNRDYSFDMSHNQDWDLFWSDAGVLPERVSKMKPYQKVNHFPGMF